MNAPSDDQLCQLAEDFIAANQGKEQSFFRSSELPYFLDKGSAEYECIAALLRNAWEAGHKAGMESDGATARDTTSLQPCPFCGSPKASLDGSVGGAFVSCDLCEARGPFIEYEQVNYPQSVLRTTDPPVKVVGQGNDEYLELQNKAMRAAKVAAVAAWNRRGASQSLPSQTATATEEPPS